MPLWVGCFNTADRPNVSRKVLAYIDRLQLDKYPGGVPNTLADTNEQWDYPNVWPPMQYILVEGLRTLGSKGSSDLAFNWASRWVRSNFVAYKKTQAMFEKVSSSSGEIGLNPGRADDLKTSSH